MKKLIYTLPLLLALGACSNEDSLNPGNQPVPQDGAFYLTFEVENIAAPGTKAGGNVTESDGTSDAEVPATDNENAIDNITLFFIGNENSGDNSGNYEKVLLALDATTIKQEEEKTKHKVEVKLTGAAQLIPICGQNVSLVLVANKYVDGTNGANGFTYTLNTEATSNDAKDATFTATIDGERNLVQKFGTLGQKVPMVSYVKTDLTIFKPVTGASNSNLIPIIDLFTEGYTSLDPNNTTKGKVLSLSMSNNPIELERAVARIDFADRTETEREAEMGAVMKSLANCYKLGTSNAIVKLTQLEAFNMSATSYLFRNVIAGKAESAYSGTSIDEILLGKENGYTSGDIYNWVSNPDWTSAGFSGNTRSFLNSYGTGSRDAKITPTELTNTYTANGGYYPWLYVTETTVPTTELMQNDNMKKYGLGVEFTFQVMDKTGSTPIKTDNATAENLPAGVTKVTIEGKDYLRIVRTEDGKYRDVELTADGAFIKYIGWLKHNNTQANSGESFAPMGLGVVRNNVYQCKVKSIGTQDWKDAQDLYLELEVQVKQWQKRQNDFEF